MRNAYNESGSNETSITSELKKLIHAEINNFLMGKINSRNEITRIFILLSVGANL